MFSKKKLLNNKILNIGLTDVILRVLPVICFVLILLNSCKKSDGVTKQDASNSGNYFSIKEFAIDQWKTYKGQPFGLEKTVFMNGKTDKILTNADVVDWAAIFRIFYETDISDPKYLDKYDFSQFIDETTKTENYYYQAKDPKLFTQKLHIIANALSHRITTIYIETARNNKLGARIQRLYYEPVKSILIQEFESTPTGGKKDIRVEYRFL